MHDTGVREVARLDAEMKAIAERSFGTGDVPALMQRLRTDRQYMFRSRRGADRLLEGGARPRARRRRRSGSACCRRPTSGIEPYPAFREKNAPERIQPAVRGWQPSGGCSTSAPTKRRRRRKPTSSRRRFTRRFPGITCRWPSPLERKEIHPIGRYIFNSGYVEGWALYAEGLADEMKLFSADLDRLGMLSSQNLRAARLVVDTGLHALGWTRQQAIDYMLAHTPQSPRRRGVGDRPLHHHARAGDVVHARACSRSVAAREEAQRAGGTSFDIKAFHDRVLEDGGCR